MNWKRIIYGLALVGGVLSLFHPALATPGVLLAVSVIGGTGTTAQKGARGTEGTYAGPTTNERVIDMSDKIFQLDPNKSKLLVLLQKLRSNVAINPTVEWLEDEYLPTSDTTSASAASTATTISVNSGEYFAARDVIKCLETGEVMCVKDTSNDDLTVYRSVGGTAAAAISSGSTILIIGNASPENAGGRVLKSTVKARKYNYCQIFRTPYGNSRTLEHSKLYGGRDMAYQGKKAGVEHEQQIERAFFFGEIEDTIDVDDSQYFATGYPIRFMAGLEDWIDTNITSSATLTADGMEDFLQTGLRYGGENKVLIVSRQVYSYLNRIAAAPIQTMPTTREFPLRIMSYVGGHGTVPLLVHNQMTGPAYNATLNPNVRYTGYMWLLDFDNLYYRFLDGANTHIRRNIQANDVDGQVDEYLTEATLQVIHERSHAIWRGIRQYA